MGAGTKRKRGRSFGKPGLEDESGGRSCVTDAARKSETIAENETSARLPLEQGLSELRSNLSSSDSPPLQSSASTVDALIVNSLDLKSKLEQNLLVHKQSARATVDTSISTTMATARAENSGDSMSGAVEDSAIAEASFDALPLQTVDTDFQIQELGDRDTIDSTKLSSGREDNLANVSNDSRSTSALPPRVGIKDNTRDGSQVSLGQMNLSTHADVEGRAEDNIATTYDYLGLGKPTQIPDVSVTSSGQPADPISQVNGTFEPSLLGQQLILRDPEQVTAPTVELPFRTAELSAVSVGSHDTLSNNSQHLIHRPPQESPTIVSNTDAFAGYPESDIKLQRRYFAVVEPSRLKLSGYRSQNDFETTSIAVVQLDVDSAHFKCLACGKAGHHERSCPELEVRAMFKERPFRTGIPKYPPAHNLPPYHGSSLL